jgi:uncharacterized protein (UPF0332 family)
MKDACLITSPFASKLARKSNRAIRSAHLGLRDGDCDGAVNRAYYAMFNIARAALLTAGVPEESLPGTHQELIAAFRQYAVQTGQVDRKLAGVLSRTETLRLQADYTEIEVDAKSAAETVERAEDFVRTIERMFALRLAAAKGESAPDQEPHGGSR